MPLERVNRCGESDHFGVPAHALTKVIAERAVKTRRHGDASLRSKTHQAKAENEKRKCRLRKKKKEKKRRKRKKHLKSRGQSKKRSGTCGPAVRDISRHSEPTPAEAAGRRRPALTPFSGSGLMASAVRMARRKVRGNQTYSQLFSDPGKKMEPFLGKTMFSGAATKQKREQESVPLN